MARRREQTGVWVRSRTTWTVKYRKYGVDGDAKNWKWAFHFFGLKSKMGVRQADRARKEFMREVNAQNHRPDSLMSLSDFVVSRFEPQVVWKKKPSGQKHYAYLLGKIVFRCERCDKILPQFCQRVDDKPDKLCSCASPKPPLLSQRSLSDIGPDDIEDLVRLLFERGYAGQTVLHFKNCLSAIFRHAKKHRMFRDDNPASLVELPEFRHERRPSYTIEQVRILLARLGSPEREMAKLSIATSMGPAEMCGITLRWSNLTDQNRMVEGVTLAPYSIAVVENFYEGKRGSLKNGSRRRVEGITPELAEELLDLVACSRRQDEEAPLFQSSRGTPKDAHNIGNRVFPTTR